MGTSRIVIGLALAIGTALAIAAVAWLRRAPPPLELSGMGIQGTVSRKLGAGASSPLAGALIELYDVESRKPLGSTTADAWGRFALPVAGAANCRVRVSMAPEFEREERDLRIDGRHVTDFSLLERSEQIAGVVVTTRGRPVAGARVMTEENPTIVVTSDAAGAFQLERAAAKDYRVRVEHPSIKAYVFYPIAGGRRDLTLLLPDADDERDPVPHADRAEGLIGKEAPPLAWRMTLLGDPLPDVRDRVVLLHFFASYHHGSTQYLHDLAAAAHADDFVLIPIHHAGAETTGLTTFLESLGLDQPVAIDLPDQSGKLGSRTFARFGVTRLPTDVVLSRTGRVAAVLPAKASTEQILSAIQQAR